MQSTDLILSGGRIVTPDKKFEADIAISNGKIIAIGHASTMPNSIMKLEIKGLTILPGIIDEHVHFREPGMADKEDIHTGSRAAAAGGVTTVIDMPNTKPPLTTLVNLREKKNLILGRTFVDIGVYAAIVEQNLAEMRGLAQEGVLGFKVFMGETTGYVKCPPNSNLLQAFSEAAKLGLPVGAHAENDDLIQLFKQTLILEGRTDPKAHTESRPPLIEEEAVIRGILLSREAGNAFHVFHLSSMESLEHVRRAKKSGFPVTAEVLVGHLMLDDHAYAQLGNQIRLNPPIRSKDQVHALWHGLNHGWLDTVATDHAPHLPREKMEENVWNAACGFIGVETALPLMLTAVNRGQISLSRYVKVACENPARLWGLYPRKGAIQVGADADFAIVDLDAKGLIDSAKLHNKYTLTPYEGYKVQGIPRYTILRGNIIMAEGEILEPAVGTWIGPMN